MWEKNKRYPSYYACMIDSDFCNAYSKWAFKTPYLKIKTYFSTCKGAFTGQSIHYIYKNMKK